MLDAFNKRGHTLRYAPEQSTISHEKPRVFVGVWESTTRLLGAPARRRSGLPFIGPSLVSLQPFVFPPEFTLKELIPEVSWPPRLS